MPTAGRIIARRQNQCLIHDRVSIVYNKKQYPGLIEEIPSFSLEELY